MSAIMNNNCAFLNDNREETYMVHHAKHFSGKNLILVNYAPQRLFLSLFSIFMIAI